MDIITSIINEIIYKITYIDNLNTIYNNIIEKKLLIVNGKDLCIIIKTLFKRKRFNLEQFVNSEYFNSLQIPQISLINYLHRIVKYTNASAIILKLSLINIIKLIDNHKIFVNKYNIHRLLLTSIMIFNKYHDDIHFSNKYWSRVGGISLKELNKLELHYLEINNFNINTSLDNYNKYIL
jgi:hypothetical protein